MTDSDYNLKLMILGESLSQKTSSINQDFSDFYLNDLNLNFGLGFFYMTIDVIIIKVKYFSGIFGFSINSIMKKLFALKELNSSFSEFHF